MYTKLKFITERWVFFFASVLVDFHSDMDTINEQQQQQKPAENEHLLTIETEPNHFWHVRMIDQVNHELSTFLT